MWEKTRRARDPTAPSIPDDEQVCISPALNKVAGASGTELVRRAGDLRRVNSEKRKRCTAIYDALLADQGVLSGTLEEAHVSADENETAAGGGNSGNGTTHAAAGAGGKRGTPRRPDGRENGRGGVGHGVANATVGSYQHGPGLPLVEASTEGFRRGSLAGIMSQLEARHLRGGGNIGDSYTGAVGEGSSSSLRPFPNDRSEYHASGGGGGSSLSAVHGHNRVLGEGTASDISRSASNGAFENSGGMRAGRDPHVSSALMSPSTPLPAATASDGGPTPKRIRLSAPEGGGGGGGGKNSTMLNGDGAGRAGDGGGAATDASHNGNVAPTTTPTSATAASRGGAGGGDDSASAMRRQLWYREVKMNDARLAEVKALAERDYEDRMKELMAWMIEEEGGRHNRLGPNAGPRPASWDVRL